MEEKLQLLIYLYPVLIFSATLHEFFHGLASNACGDPTPRMQGRLTLNPMAHIDLIGTVILPIFIILSGSHFLFGWAKPVQVNPLYYRRPRRDNAFVAFAGPAANLLIVAVIAIIARIAIQAEFENVIFYTFLSIFVQLNLVLFFFNLIPLPPLDGHHIVEMIYPPASILYNRLKMMGPILLFLLLIFILNTGIFSNLFFPIIEWVNSIIFYVPPA